MNKENIPVQERVLSFLSRYRIVILGLVGTVLAVFAGLGIYALISYQRDMDAIAVVDRAFLRFEKWERLSADAPQFAELQKEILDILSPFDTPRSETYAGAKALWTLSRIQRKLGDIEKEGEYLRKILEWYPNSVFDIDAGYRLAAIYLDTARPQQAIDLFETLSKRRDLPAIFREEILFALGVLLEETDSERSRRHFDELIQTYPLSDWTKLARSRILSRETTTR